MGRMGRMGRMAVWAVYGGTAIRRYGHTQSNGHTVRCFGYHPRRVDSSFAV